jgi:hypothetical protein
MSPLWLKDEESGIERQSKLVKAINTLSGVMKFNFFGKRHKCTKCGKKFKDELELADHNRTAHPT